MDDKPRRVLWIAYVFPPIGGTQGVRMQRYLQEIIKADPSLQVDVLTIQQNRDNPQFDEMLSQGLPDSVRVHRVRPGALHQLRYKWLLDRHSLAQAGTAATFACLALIHLSNLAWLPRAAAWIARRVWSTREKYDGVYVFVDPFASLALGLMASILNPRAQLVLEYGDPRMPVRNGARPLLRLAELLESGALRRCNAAIFRTQTVVHLYAAHYPSIPADRFSVLYGGVDWEPYDAVPAPAADSDGFLIVYTGTIYADSVDPAPFFHAVAHLSKMRLSVKVNISGAESAVVKRLVHDLDLDQVVSFTGHVPASQVVPIQRAASVLLAFGVRQPYKISSKLAQYVAARVPILYVGNSEEDPGAEVVSESRRGLSVRNDVDDIVSAILEVRQRWLDGDLGEIFDLSRTGEFSWCQVGGVVDALLKGCRKDVRQ